LKTIKKPRSAKRGVDCFFKEKNTETFRKNSLALPGLPSCLPLRPTYLLSFRCFKKISIEQTFPKIQKNFLKLPILSA
jgi:hypothetical protein